jgi:hypothetical protein
MAGPCFLRISISFINPALLPSRRRNCVEVNLVFFGLKSFSHQSTTNADDFVHFSQRLTSSPDYVALEQSTRLALLDMVVELAEILYIGQNTSDGIIWEGACLTSQAILEGILCLQNFTETSSQ